MDLTVTNLTPDQLNPPAYRAFADSTASPDPEMAAAFNKALNAPPKRSFVLGTLSHHFSKDPYYTDHGQRLHYNERNGGFGIEERKSDGTFSSMQVYENSLRTTTLVFSRGVETDCGSNLGVGGQVGLAIGYRTPIIPAATVFARAGKCDNMNLVVGLVPPIPGSAPAVGYVQLRFPFN